MSTMNENVYHILNSVPDYIQKVCCDTTLNTPPFKCAVKSCRNKFSQFSDRHKYPYKFHNFPVTKKLRKIWKLQCGWCECDHMKGLMVCSDHFKLNDYIRNYKEEFINPAFKRKLKYDAYPTESLGPRANQLKIDEIADDDYDTDMETLTDHCLQGPKNCADDFAIEEPLDSTQVEQEVDYNLKLRKKQVELNKELDNLKSKVNIRKRKIKNTRLKIQKKRENFIKEYMMAKRVFSKSQIKLLQGKKVHWTDDDLARAFTLRHMSTKKCYLYMKNTLNVPLPALACVQKWANAQE